MFLKCAACSLPLAVIDGAGPPPDWMAVSPQRDAPGEEVGDLIAEPCHGSVPPLDRVVLRLTKSRRLAVEPDDGYDGEASGDDRIVRKRSRQTIRDVRTPGEVTAVFDRCHFERFQDRWAAHLRRVGEIRLQRDSVDGAVIVPAIERVRRGARRAYHVRLQRPWRRCRGRRR